MKVSHITQEHLVAAAKALPPDARFTDVANKAIEIALAELKALYEQQVKGGTVDNFVWSRKDVGMENFAPLGVPPAFFPFHEYRCTPKPTCQIRNLDTDELKTMTREAAKKLQAELGDTVEWSVGGTLFTTVDDPFNFQHNGIYTYKLKVNLVKLDGKLMTREAAIAIWESKKDTCDLHHKNANHQTWWDIGVMPAFDTHDDKGTFGEYQLRERPLKQIRWEDVPVGVNVLYKPRNSSHYLRCVTANSKAWLEELYETPYLDARDLKDIELSPADQQPWFNWRGGECPVPEGVMVEVTLRSGTVKNDLDLDEIDWSHTKDSGDIIEYRVTGIAKGWELI